MGIRLPQINIAGTLMILVVVGGLVAAGKFIPVYLQATEVESILDGYRHNAATLDVNDHSDVETRILESATGDIVALGIDERYLDVYFTDNLTELVADYQVVVTFPFDKSVTLEMTRSTLVPQ